MGNQVFFGWGKQNGGFSSEKYLLKLPYLTPYILGGPPVGNWELRGVGEGELRKNSANAVFTQNQGHILIKHIIVSKNIYRPSCRKY